MEGRKEQTEPHRALPATAESPIRIRGKYQTTMLEIFAKMVNS